MRVAKVVNFTVKLPQTVANVGSCVGIKKYISTLAPPRRDSRTKCGAGYLNKKKSMAYTIGNT